MSIVKSEYLFFLVIRVLIGVFFVRNYDHPDQYWQGPEIAHKIVYGYGYQTWQWTMHQPIRSPLYPLFLASGYWFVAFLKQASVIQKQLEQTLLSVMPWILNSFIAALGDFYLLKLMKFYYGRYPSTLTVVLVFSNWFYLGNMSRTYVNGMQTSLTVVAFYYWIMRGHSKYNDLVSRTIVFICYLVRATSIVFWVVVWPYQLLTMFFYKNNFGLIVKFVIKNLLQIVLMVIGSLIVSFLWYGKWHLTQLNFVKYNMIYGWSSLFGSHSFFTYFLILPGIMVANIVLFLVTKTVRGNNSGKNRDQVKQQIKYAKIKELLLLCTLTLLVLSFSSHKQMRYILVLVPFLLIIMASSTQYHQTRFSSKIIKATFFIVIAMNLLLFLSIDFYGKTGSNDVLVRLKSQVDLLKKPAQATVFILGQPHSLPLFCSLHRNIIMGLPDSSAIMKAKGEDQADLLIKDPNKLIFILENRTQISKPSFIILQEKYSQFVVPALQDYLKDYQIVATFKNVKLIQQIFLDNYDAFSLYRYMDQKVELQSQFRTQPVQSQY